MNAIVLSVGDELVSGLTINTNASWLSQQLTALGIATLRHTTVPDQLDPIVAAITQAADPSVGCDLLLVSGGLGPTDDDLTRNALAAALGDKLIEDPAARIELEAFFRARQRPMTPSNLCQAQRPASARCLPNPHGTAPGLAATLRRTAIYVMPGVPREMREMFAASIRPDLLAHTGNRVTLTTKINTFGLGESALGEKIQDLMVRGGYAPGLTVGTTVHEGIVSVRIYATGTPDEARDKTDRIRRIVHQRLGTLVFGENEETLEQAAINALHAANKTLATAESCTGGLLAQLVTNVPGASQVFLRGWVTYANQAKREELAVPAELLERHGAVSEPVALAMAAGARTAAATDFALATTGIAGPDGGTSQKPVGTVWIALATPAAVHAWCFNFPGDRAAVRQRAAQRALATLRWQLVGEPGN